MCEYEFENHTATIFLDFCEFLHSLIGFDIESLPRTIYTENVEKPSSEDPLISILTPILNDTSNARGNELAALSLIDPFNSRIPQLPKRLQKSMTCFSNALLRVNFIFLTMSTGCSSMSFPVKKARYLC